MSESEPPTGDEVSADDEIPEVGSDPASDVPSREDATGEAEAGSRRTRRIALAVGLVVLALVAVVATVLVVSSDDEDPAYDDETRAAFLAACTGDGGDEVADVCACIYDGIEAEIPYDRFVEVDEQLTAQREEDPEALVEELPDDIDAVRAGCVEEVGPVATTTTTTDAGDVVTTTVAAAGASDTTDTVASD